MKVNHEENNNEQIRNPQIFLSEHEDIEVYNIQNIPSRDQHIQDNIQNNPLEQKQQPEAIHFQNQEKYMNPSLNNNQQMYHHPPVQGTVNKISNPPEYDSINYQAPPQYEQPPIYNYSPSHINQPPIHQPLVENQLPQIYSQPPVQPNYLPQQYNSQGYPQNVSNQNALANNYPAGQNPYPGQPLFYPPQQQSYQPVMNAQYLANQQQNNRIYPQPYQQPVHPQMPHTYIVNPNNRNDNDDQWSEESYYSRDGYGNIKGGKKKKKKKSTKKYRDEDHHVRSTNNIYFVPIISINNDGCDHGHGGNHRKGNNDDKKKDEHFFLTFCCCGLCRKTDTLIKWIIDTCCYLLVLPWKLCQWICSGSWHNCCRGLCDKGCPKFAKSLYDSCTKFDDCCANFFKASEKIVTKACEQGCGFCQSVCNGEKICGLVQGCWECLCVSNCSSCCGFIAKQCKKLGEIGEDLVKCCAPLCEKSFQFFCQCLCCVVKEVSQLF